MIDRNGRKIDYLRISLTDRCNLRCVYCMPADGIVQVRHEDILTYDEITRICRVMAELGIKKVKLTGGEPLVRKNCAWLVRELKSIDGIENVTLTTNGVLLKDQIKDLTAAGLDAVNVSLDTLDPELFFRITRRDSLDNVLDGIQAALAVPGLNIKINCVPVAGFSFSENVCPGRNGYPEEDFDLEVYERNLTKIAGLARDNKMHVRFIEIMPIGVGRQIPFKDEASIVQVLEKTYGAMRKIDERYGNGPGHYYCVEGFQGKIGFISAVSHKFCDQCNRIRLTSEGFLKGCLQYQKGMSLRDRIREGCSDDELTELIRQVIKDKPVGHNFFAEETDMDEERIMSQIGG